MKKLKSPIIFLSMFLLIFSIAQVSNPVEANAKKAKYTIKTEKLQYKDDNGKVRGVVSYQYPQFSGSSKKIKAINKAIKKKCNAFMNSSTAKSMQKLPSKAIASIMTRRNIIIKPIVK